MTFDFLLFFSSFFLFFSPPHLTAYSLGLTTTTVSATEITATAGIWGLLQRESLLARAYFTLPLLRLLAVKQQLNNVMFPINCPEITVMSRIDEASSRNRKRVKPGLLMSTHS